MFLMPRVFLNHSHGKLKMHHMRTFFLCGVTFFVLFNAHSQHIYLQEESLPSFLHLIKLLWMFPDQIYLQLINSGHADSSMVGKKQSKLFPLEDKHVVNEHHTIRNTHDATQKNCPHMVWNKLVASKHYSEGGQKNLWVLRSTGQSSIGRHPFQTSESKWRCSSRNLAARRCYMYFQHFPLSIDWKTLDIHVGSSRM